MRLLTREMVLLQQPDRDELDGIYLALKSLHAKAYAWEPPDVPGLERLGATRMRQHVRAWINAWDLIRADPTYSPVAVTSTVAVGWSDQDELEESVED